jgi:hypothetical protein
MNIKQGISKSEVLFRHLQGGGFNNKRNNTQLKNPPNIFKFVLSLFACCNRTLGKNVNRLTGKEWMEYQPK